MSTDEKKISTPIVTEREARLEKQRKERAARPAYDKNHTADLTVGDTQCAARTAHEGPRDRPVSNFCRLVDGHAKQKHITYDGIEFETTA